MLKFTVASNAHQIWATLETIFHEYIKIHEFSRGDPLVCIILMRQVVLLLVSY